MKRPRSNPLANVKHEKAEHEAQLEKALQQIDRFVEGIEAAKARGEA